MNVLRLTTLAGVITCLSAVAADLPQYDDNQHLGVASCASGVCHGSVRERTGTAILQNEYVVWSRQDRHRVAYQTLLTDESRRIARNLGLENAHQADICLDCHADNAANRSARFQLDDGVGCEACHGGAEQYVSTHVDDANSRADNIAAGLYPLDNPVKRAELCLSCHLGTKDKMATHKIMGAGHPRLAFELDTFGVLQPAHYVVDEDYRQRKWSGDSMQVWLIGQTRSAMQTLSLIEQRLDTGKRFPELALFDCHACHHPMSDQRWQAGSGTGQAPGAVRLNDANFVMLLTMVQVLMPGEAQALHQQMKALHNAVASGGSVMSAVAALRQSVTRIETEAPARLNIRSANDLLNGIVAAGREGRYRDYVAAEQAVMAVDMLLSRTKRRDDHQSWLDEVYDAVSDEDAFEPFRLRAAFGRFKS
ncbi:MAG: hypothetical protein KDI36_13740 [Pseudomonadales bacterium]|nr:hypothetical protein [Pseudomonadales bacterium]